MPSVETHQDAKTVRGVKVTYAARGPLKITFDCNVVLALKASKNAELCFCQIPNSLMRFPPM